jgi:ATP/ADP translocase
MPFAGLGRSLLLPSLGRRLLRFLGVFGGAALIISGKLNLTFFSARDVLISVDVNLCSVAVNAVLGFFVAALFRISTKRLPKTSRISLTRLELHSES